MWGGGGGEGGGKILTELMLEQTQYLWTGMALKHGK